MTYLTIIVLMLVAFTVVGWPLISSSHASAPKPAEASRLDALSGQRDAVYRAIKELEFEYQLGNLSSSDYQSLRERYRSDAAAVLRRLDTAVQEGAAPSGDATGATQIASVASGQAGLSCPSCGKPRDVSDRFCWSCGAQLGRGCPDCGGPLVHGEGCATCPICGYSHCGA